MKRGDATHHDFCSLIFLAAEAPVGGGGQASAWGGGERGGAPVRGLVFISAGLLRG